MVTAKWRTRKALDEPAWSCEANGMRRSLFLALIVTACAAPKPKAVPPEPPSPATKLRDAILKDSRAHEYTRELSDRIGPRLAGSPGDARAVAWAKTQMEDLGLRDVRTEPVKVPHWVRGVETAQILTPAPQPLTVTAIGGSISTPADGVEAEIVEAASFDDFAKLPDAAIKGKIAFFNAVMPRTASGQGYGANHRYRTESAAIAAKRGAVAVLIRSLSTGDARLPHTGVMMYADGTAKIPAAALSTPDAELLHRLGGRIRVRLVLTCQTLPDATSANVIGEIRGREKPDEIVLLGAHLDAWDLGSGAQDDGAGVGIVLETARQILAANAPPRRTIRFILFANEENGLRGAAAYALAHKAELPQHTVATEADGGDGAPTGLSYLGGPEQLAAVAPIAQLLAPLGVGAPEQADHHGADLTPLRAAGVPMVSVHQDATRYFDVHHSADDTYDKIRPDQLARATAAFATVTYAAADSPSSFGRLPEPAPPSATKP